MKLLLTIPILFFSCANYMQDLDLYSIKDDAKFHKAWKETARFKRISDGETNYWKSPKEFLLDGGGDCEDFSTYLISILGKESSLVVIKSHNVLHAIVRYKDVYIEPQLYGAYYKDITILWELSYKDTMALSTNWNTKK
jgi:hypothetical protein